MHIRIKAKPRSKLTYVKKITATEYVVAVSEPPINGKANTAIIQALATYFSLPKSQIVLISGERAKQKIFAVPFDAETLESFGEKQRKLF